MADTTHLVLPLLAAAQAQKHVTHNEALLRLDAIVQLAVIDRDLTAPPANPSDGDRYIPAPGATGAWAGWDLNIAWFVDGVWTKLVPKEGWRAWVADEDLLLVWDGAAWQRQSLRSAFSVHKDNTNQIVPSATSTKVTWSAEVYDPDSTFDLANHRWQPGKGTAVMVGMLRILAGVVNQAPLQALLYKNDVLLQSIAYVVPNGTVEHRVPFTTIELAESGDNFHIGFHGSGAGDKTIQGAPAGTFWKGFLL